MPSRVEASPSAIETAARRLQEGGLVAFPTETVYGLGADTFNEAALRRVYELKGRPADNPLIAHVRGEADAQRIVADWDERAATLARQFWPGPLSLILKPQLTVPSVAVGGRGTIAVRSPKHPVALALLEAFGSPISAPSANRSGHVSPTQADHVEADFPEADDLFILDGGPSPVGIESTVLDLTQTPALILRPGAISAEAIARALSEAVTVARPREQAASPGTSPVHYAPHTPLELVSRDELLEQLSTARDPYVVLVIGWMEVPPPHSLQIMPADPELYAAMLYDTLRKADRAKCRKILVEKPTMPGEMWDAVRDRLQRASAPQGRSRT